MSQHGVSGGCGFRQRREEEEVGVGPRDGKTNGFRVSNASTASSAIVTKLLRATYAAESVGGRSASSQLRPSRSMSRKTCSAR